MAEYIKLYGTVNEYLQTEDDIKYVSSIIPGVAYVEEDEGVRYNRKKGPVLKVVFITTNNDETLYISMSDVYGMTVNGEPWEYDNEHPYTAHTPGEYVVEIELEEGTTELLGSINYATDIYVPEGITYVGGGFTGAGTGSGMKGKLYLPSTLEELGESDYYPAFTSYDGQPGELLNEITCLARVAPHLNNRYEFYLAASNGTLHRPAGSDYSSWFGGNHLPNTWTEEDI